MNKNLEKQIFLLTFASHLKTRAFSSAGLEHLPYKQRVGGSNPSTPTGVFPVISSEVAGFFFCLYTSRLKCDTLFIWSYQIKIHPINLGGQLRLVL